MYIFITIIYIFQSLSGIIARGSFKFRVENGTPAAPAEFPYQVAMKKQQGAWYITFCGGAIIAPTKVLTAAHCFDIYNYTGHRERVEYICCKPRPRSINKFRNVYVVGGNSKTLSKYSDINMKNSQWRKPRKVIPHSSYNFPKNDIAVLIVTNPFEYNDYINELPYAEEYEDYEELKCIASGFGEIKLNEKPPALMWATIEVLDTKTCSERFYMNMINMICSSSRFSDVGRGDSGGPLVCFKTGHKNEGKKGILVGIVCGKGLYSSVFTRVSSYKNFIDTSRASTMEQDFTSWISVSFYFWNFLSVLL